MTQLLPKFSKPPIVETVMGVQFAPLPKYSAAFAGLFWKSLEPTWADVSEVSKLEDSFERFDDGPVGPFPQIRFKSIYEAGRVQIINAATDKMIQIQSSKFFLNWRKQNPAHEYPSYAVLLPEFMALFRRFQSFCIASGLGEVKPNGWELTYVNQVKRNEIWSSPTDVYKIVPSVLMPDLPDAVAETLSNDWRYTIDNRGRLYITLRHVRLSDGSNTDAMHLQLLARGMVDSQTNLQTGLDLGHRVIAQAFGAIISPEAQSRWGRST